MERRASPKKRATAKPSASLGRAAWVSAAWAELARGGVEAVRVEPIAVRLGVSKGSFYWHFRDRAELLSEILADWEARATAAVIALVDASSNAPRARLVELLRVTTRAPQAPDVELAIRAWGARDQAVRTRLARIDERREHYVQGLIEAVGVPPAKAELRARALYLALIGEYARVAHGGAPTSHAAWMELLERMLDGRRTARGRPRSSKE